MGGSLSKYGQYMVIWVHEPAGRNGVFAAEKLWKALSKAKLGFKSPVSSRFERSGAIFERICLSFEPFVSFLKQFCVNLSSDYMSGLPRDSSPALPSMGPSSEQLSKYGNIYGYGSPL